MSIRDLGVCLALLVLPCCGGEPQAKSPDGSVGGPVTDLERLYPLENNTVFSYVTFDDAGTTGIYVIEVSRSRPTMAELKIASKVHRREIGADGIQVPGGGYVLRAPLTADAEWPGEFGSVAVKSLSRSIKVPAGEFANCVETVESLNTPAISKTATSVFCPGVGMVYYQFEAEQDGEPVSLRLELKTFGPRFTGM